MGGHPPKRLSAPSVRHIGEGSSVTWRKTAWVVLFSPILIGLLLIVGIFAVWKLPMVCCERFRAVRYLSLFGLCYYSAAITVAAVSLGLVWWEVSVIAGLAILGGEWLLPDPVSWLFRPAKRRAVARAIEYVEQRNGPWVLYGMVAVVGAELERHVVSVAVDTGTRPPGRRFVAVRADGAIEELDFNYVAANHGVRACY